MSNKTVEENVTYVAIITMRRPKMEVRTLSQEEPIFISDTPDIIEHMTAPTMIELLDKVHDHLRFDDRDLECVEVRTSERKVRITTEVLE